jgi:hypothetical protein
VNVQRPFPGNRLVNTPTTIQELLEAVFSVGSAPRLYNEDPRPAEGITERELSVGSSVEFCKELRRDGNETVGSCD